MFRRAEQLGVSRDIEREPMVLADIGITIVRTEVVKDEMGRDKWYRYTVEDGGETHTVGTRVEPLISDRGFRALEAARATRYGQTTTP